MARFELIDSRSRAYVRHDDAGRLHVADRADVSPRYLGHPTSACGWCWLGASHSEAAHERKIAGSRE